MQDARGAAGLEALFSRWTVLLTVGAGLAVGGSVWVPGPAGVQLGLGALGCGLAGVFLGLLGRPRERDRFPRPPWGQLAAAALGVTGVGWVGWGLFGSDAVGLGFAASAVGPGLALVVGGLLGTHVRSLAAVVAGSLAWVAGAGGGYLLARQLWWDSEGAAWGSLVWSILTCLAVGAMCAIRLGRLAFAEVCAVAVTVSTLIFFSVSADPTTFSENLNAPIPQILAATVFLPPLVTTAWLTVGASLGFLMFGGGGFEPRFWIELKVALRYLQAQSRTAVVGAVTVVALLGVCLGVMALIVVLSIMSGFEADLKDKILSAHPHLMVSKHGDDFAEYQEVERQAARVQGVRSATAFILGDAMVSTDVGLSGTLVKGLSPESRAGFNALKQSLEQGSIEYLVHPSQIPGACPKTPKAKTSTTPSEVPGAQGPALLEDPAVLGRASCGRVLPGIILGRELSRSLRAYVGDVVKLVSPSSDELGPMGPVPKLRRFRVAGVAFTGMYEYDAKFSYLAMQDAQRFFGMRDRATGVELKIEELDWTSRVVRDVRDVLGGEPYVVRDWRELNRELFSALLLEKIAMFIALTMIVMVASFLIVATLVMIVLQRGKEIAILKSIGATDASVMKIFVLQGLVVGVGGALLGVLGGVTACWYLQTFGFKLDDRVFYIDKLPVVMDQTEVAIIALAAVTISYLATIYPAMTAAQLDPVDGLRDD